MTRLAYHAGNVWLLAAGGLLVAIAVTLVADGVRWWRSKKD